MEMILLDIVNFISATVGTVARFFLDMSVGMTAIIGLYYILTDQELETYLFQNWLSD